MSDFQFVWSSGKARINRKKHKVSFEEACTVFYDENALIISDPDHSAVEERFIMLGMSGKMRVLIVCHCYKENERVIRIISARRAAKSEAKKYWEKI
jgi:hypothetical protein